MATLSKTDLDFILAQILIAEAHAGGADLLSLMPSVFAPLGLRTVDGSYNNLIPGQSEFGAADNNFPFLLDQVFRDDLDGDTFGTITNTNYATSGPGASVADADPRIISNLIVDMTANNPAAYAAAYDPGLDGVLGTADDVLKAGVEIVASPGLDGIFGTTDDRDVFFIPNTTPDVGLSAPFNAWMTFFGQFFDHGLDLVDKGGNGAVFMPLQADDPLIAGADGLFGTPDDLPESQRFMLLTRATNTAVQAGADNILGTPDDVHFHNNETTPFVDQNQTYTAHASHQAFLREYELRDIAGDGLGSVPFNTGRLLDGTGEGLPTWADIKAQALMLGIQLTDGDVLDVPLIATDQYGNFIPGSNGFAQLVTNLGLIQGTAAGLNLNALPGGAIAGRTGHAFLNDIAHNAAPVFIGGVLTPDADALTGNAVATNPLTGARLEYDDELLNAHFITGDGRGNENIGLTTVHHVFHSEHNRQVAEIQATLLADATATGVLTSLNAWLAVDVAAIPADLSTLQWDGERLFQAARFATEMQYQHLVFEEFARRVQPQIDAFLAPIGYDVTINPAIVAEFAHVVYRFGHSMLTETVDRFDPNFNVVGDFNPTEPGNQQIGLIAAFLNPLAFVASDSIGTFNADEAAGAIVRGLTRQVGNEIDEFVTEALRNNLVGLPLDLPAINIARGRDTGVPTLNVARQQFFDMTHDTQLTPYTSWVDFAANLRHQESVVNFIAAYGTHASITSEITTAGKRAAALALVTGIGFGGTETERLAFLNAPAATTGVNDIDLWVGGLAEKQMPFGGLLGSTFNFVFETQLESLQNGDRFYYLSRTAGLDFAAALENNSFAKLIMLNTDATHLPADVFSTPTWILEVAASTQFTGLGVDGREDPLGGTALVPLVIRDNPDTAGVDTNYLRYTGEDHVVLGGTAGNDTIISSIGDDTIYGDAGNDRIEGGDGVDNVFGGAGDDIITDLGGDDVIHGDAGNDVIHGGNGINLIHGDSGQDFIITGEDITAVFAGAGNDFVLGSTRNVEILGGEGDDWLEFGHQEGSVGDNFDAAGRDLIAGHDVFVGNPGFEDIIAEGGDDIIFGSDGQEKMDGASGFDWADYKFETAGVTADLKISTFRSAPATPSTAGLLDLYAFVEGLSGTPFADVLRGDDMLATQFAFAGAQGSVLDQAGIARIAGLQAVVGTGVTSFSAGNIILGGDGSDIIEGRQGDDIIDGDRWLNARISVRANPDGTGAEIRSVDSMRDLMPDMLNGTINPGQLVIVREILTAAGPDFDTAMYSGALANYTVSIAFDGTTTVRDNVGTLLGTDGTDTLRNIERLQFSDQAVILPSGVGRNAAPVGLLQIRDAVLDAADNTPAVNQVLSVFAGNVTDADIAGGSIVGKPISYYWQVERGLNSGYFEDLINLTGLGGAATTFDGPTLRVPAIANGLVLDGLRLRVRAVYQDDHGVMENVFSAPTQAVSGVVAGPPPPPPIPAESAVDSPGIHLIRSDLQFILAQIVIAERHAAGEDLLSLVGNERLALGLRTVDGSFNNLVPGQVEFGAADNNFPLLLDQVFRNDLDGDTFDANGPAPGGLITNTNYATSGPGGNVVDADPRIISNLIVDMTANNPDAYAAAYDPGPDGVLGTAGAIGDDVLKDGVEIVASPGLDGIFGTTDDRAVFFIPNTTPDVGLSAPFNAWMTFFGQFFDHGLDLVDKGGNGAVFMPLQADDPLIAGADGLFGTLDDLPASQRFMLLTRATNTAVQAGADGTFGTPDDVHFHNNETTPFVDQNQTYTADPSHQVFLREYASVLGVSVNTGRLLEGTGGGLATWADVKAQAALMLGITLTDSDIFDVPMVAVDFYGNFIPAANGLAQLVTNQGLIPGAIGGLNLNALPGGAIAGRTGHAFLNDIAHNAVPGSVFDTDGDPTTPGTSVVQADADAIAGNAIATDFAGRKVAYDDELLNAHFITGDGRGNENIGLTTVHHIFHSEHNRLVDHIKDVAIASNDVAFLNEWLSADVATLPTTAAAIAALQWDGERLFQAARFATEMQYQHLVFEEFARTVQPQIDLFFATTQVYDTTLNPAIVAEFAHVVYRFGHSMLTETVDRFDPSFNVIDTDPLHPAQTGSGNQLGLIAAFLNPLAFVASDMVGLTFNADEAAGAIVRGLTRQVGNEIDEFVTEALRNNLVGLPLDLPAINIARGRDTGVPTLNVARQEFYTLTGDAQLAPYKSWVDFAAHLRHQESVVNFIAAYGTHTSITGAITTAAKRAAALAIVTGGVGAPADALAFLNGPAATTGVNDIDLWIGGLAEAQMPFGGLLGSTFNFVFETQMEKLQDGDRFYYLERTAGLNFLTELEGNSFAKLVMANTDATHLPGNIFTTPNFILEVNQLLQFNAGLGSDDPTGGSVLVPLVTRDPGTNFLKYTGEDHVVMGGTPGNDIIIASIGDDTLYGDAGNDRLEGGDGVDVILGGPGDDILTDLGGDDLIQGGDGNDAIQGGNGINLIIGGFGTDFINSGEDASEVFGGPGNDFILGSRANEQDMGNEGDDWLEHGNADGSPGDNFDPFALDPVVGNDVYIGDTVVDIMNAEGGDDIMVGNGGQQDHYLGASGYDWADYKDSPVGVIVFVDLLFENEATALGANPSTLDRYQSVEGISGSQYGDYLIGADQLAPFFATSGFTGSILTNIDLIDGLREILAPGATSFTGEILLGGAGSDVLRGGWGDEVLDGDAWLNVQIGVYNDLAHTTLLSRHNSMTEIQNDVFAGLINPGQLGIIREIRTTLLDGTPIAGFLDFDTAVFRANLADYTVEAFLASDNGTPLDVTDDIFYYVVTDVGSGLDGVDIVRNVERLQFADQSLVVNGFNEEPVGLVTVNDNTPTEDQLLTASLDGVTDANNISLANPTGAITGPVTYYWQTEATGGTFVDIIVDNGITTGPATGATFRPTDFEVGSALRVRAVYKDANGVVEEVFSTPTGVVGGINDAPIGTVLINDTAPTQDQALVAIIAFTDADAPIDLIGGGTPPPIVYNYQWQRSTNINAAVPTWTNIAGATAATYTPVVADTFNAAARPNVAVRVVVTYVDGQGTLETVTSAPTGRIGIHLVGGVAANTQNGTPYDDWLQGLGGNDTLNGGDGSDLLDGGAGNDSLNGGLGADTMLGGTGNDTYVVNDLLDTVTENLNEGTDLVQVQSPLTSYTLGPNVENLTFVGAGAFTSTGNELANVLTGGAGNDTLNGMAGDDTLVGGAGADTLTGGAGNDTLNGNDGNDRFVATVGDGNDAYVGGAGVDTYDLSATSAAATVSFVTGTASSANTGSDTLAGIENVIGGSGNDTITGDAGNDNFDGGAGDDTLVGGTGADTLTGGAGNDSLTGGAGADSLSGGDGRDVFTYTIGNGADTVDGGADGAGGGDTLNILGAAGAQTLNVVYNGGATITQFEGGTVANVESVTANLQGGNDTLNYGATTADVTVDLGAVTQSASGFTSITSVENVTGGAGNDSLTGSAVANNLQGGAGNDVITGGAGGDTVAGGDGNDRFVATAADGADTYNGNAGIDTYDLSLLGTAATVDLVNGTATGGDTLANIENVIGSQGANTITGTGAANIIDGQGGADTINAGGGTDTITGGAGNDTMNGGAGNDVFVFSNGFGSDTITGFDADLIGGQDLLDFTGFVGVTAANFAASVIITDIGANTLVTILGTDTITLAGIGDATTVTSADFMLNP